VFDNLTRQPLEIYQDRIKFYQAKNGELEKKARNISNLRLFVALGGLSLTFYLYRTGAQLAAAGFFLVTLFIFAKLVFRHQDLKKEKAHVQTLWKINEEAVARFNETWTDFPDMGSEFIEESHSYGVDLDIFGKRSLFQLINTTTTFLGRKKITDLLLNPTLDQKDLLVRQESIKELAGHLDFRQNLQAEGRKFAKSNQDPEELFQWATSFSHLSWTSPVVMALIKLSPLVLLALTGLALLMPEVVSYYIPVTLVLCHALLLLYFSKSTSTTFSVANRYQESIKGLKEMLRLFEVESFHAPGLIKLQDNLKCKGNRPAFRQIEKLSRAVDMTYLRYHQLYLIFNFITLWDFHCMVALESWKKESGKGLKNWLHTLGEVEMLSSASLLAYDHPDWCFPQFSQENPGLKAEAIGHPLLPATRVTNDVELKHKGEILLITGSNMSGKSTFLRTVGVNLVLAYLGAPVCARSFHCGFLELYTSMRINDNLDTGTSSFFAELKRIKTILEEAQKGRPVLFLLDEIFRGTNSRDRHTGARHLIKKLSSTGAIGLVSTHDLELGDLSKESPFIKNYHFSEYYQNGKIFFDYKLKPGVSTTRNAIFLMKMAGIEIDD